MKEPQQQSLDEQLTDFYGRIELPSSAMSEMLARSARRRSSARRFLMAAGAAAAVALMAAIGVSLVGDGDRKMTGLAMAEVARNHLKGIAPEAVSSDYAEVQKRLARLDFSIDPPDGGLIDGYELVGGRYCKVLGEFAAQLKLLPRDGGPAATAYIVPAEGPLASIANASTEIDGVRVRCERSGELLVFLADEAPAP